MFLEGLTVENYRAIRKATLSLDTTTMWIGENETGRSSLLEALIKGLDADIKSDQFNFQPGHFHRVSNEPTGPILIKFHFKEKVLNEWNQDSYANIRNLLRPSIKPRHLLLELLAHPVNQGQSAAQWSLRIEGVPDPISDIPLIDWIRRYKSVIHLPAGMLTGHGIENLKLRHKPYSRDVDSNMEALIRRIEDLSYRLLTGTSANSARDIDKGFRASRELIERLNNTTSAETTLVLHLQAGMKTVDSNGGHSSQPANSRSPTQRLGFLLLVAAWLRASPEIFEIDIDPIWIVEDPEAHLHPMTLASISHLLGAIKGQKIITTFSGELVSTMHIERIRRHTRKRGVITENKVRPNILSKEDLRRISYHLGARNSNVWFDRLWLLVEGESEYWIVPQMAKIMGYDLALEGIQCVEFAQSGLSPMIKLADELGIAWHVLTDGDEAGRGYSGKAREYLSGRPAEEHVTQLTEPSIEHCFWSNGYSEFYIQQANPKKEKKPDWVIRKAIKKHSKPQLSVAISHAVEATGSPGVPEEIQWLIKTCVKMAGKSILVDREP